MGYFRIVGISAQTPEPVERIVTSALEADLQRMMIQRSCGKSGKVEVFGKDGRAITTHTLQRLIREEKAKKINPSV